MNYLLKSSKRKSSKKKYAVIIAVAIIVLINIFNISFVRNLVSPVVDPIMTSASVIVKPFHSIGSYFSSKKEMTKEIVRLETEVQLLKVRQSKVSFIEQENAILREILSRKDSGNDIILADVIRHPPQSPYDTFVINIGSNNGVKEGDYVYAFETFIGLIGDVSKRTSIVKLVSTPNEVIDVELSGNIPAEAVGQGGGRFKITLPKDILVEVGDAVFLNNAYAPVLGVIQEIEKDDISTFQVLHFNLPFNISTINIVEIIPALVSDEETL